VSAHYLVLASPSFLFQVKQSDSNHVDPICAFQSEDEGITHPVRNGGIRFLSGFVSLSLCILVQVRRNFLMRWN
jgi:hypothetical protein